MNKNILSGIADVIERFIDKQNFAGANVLVYKDGKERYYYESGYADIENKVKISRDTIFRLYSMSKPITGAAAMLLMQDGTVDLHEPVSRYIPAFANQQVATDTGAEPAKREVQLIDLLKMTSGLTYGHPDFEAGRKVAVVFEELVSRLETDSPITTLELAEKIAACPLMFQPGSRWCYGTSADIMGAVTEAATGMRYGQFLKENLFAPLGMNDTDFFVPEDKQHRLAKTYKETENGLVLSVGSRLGISDRMNKEPAFESGGAGLTSTIDDYMNFAQMLLAGGKLGGIRVFAPRTVTYYTTPQLDKEIQVRDLKEHWVNGLAGFSYGNFMRIMDKPGQAVFMGSKSEYGWDGALGVYFMNAPRENLTLLFMTQRSGSGTLPVTRRIRNIVFAALED